MRGCVEGTLHCQASCYTLSFAPCGVAVWVQRGRWPAAARTFSRGDSFRPLGGSSRCRRCLAPPPPDASVHRALDLVQTRSRADLLDGIVVSQSRRRCESEGWRKCWRMSVDMGAVVQHRMFVRAWHIFEGQMCVRERDATNGTMIDRCSGVASGCWKRDVRGASA